jgi:ParB-like chromosome segregation protein Spo0J
MMKRETFSIASIYVPAKRRATLDPRKANEIAESILENGLQVPILVRKDGERYVLVEGLHRLEACRQLGLPGAGAQALVFAWDMLLSPP